MNAEVKEKLKAALLSGEYKQGKSVLRNERDEFCCLGVLCDLAAKEGLVAWSPMARARDFIDEREGVRCYSCEGQQSWLPTAVAAWSGITEVQSEMAEANDKGRTFAEIVELFLK